MEKQIIHSKVFARLALFLGNGFLNHKAIPDSGTLHPSNAQHLRTMDRPCPALFVTLKKPHLT